MPPAINSLLAGDIIKSSRDEHPLFDKRRNGDLLLLRALSRYQRRLISKIARVNIKFMTTEIITPLPLADFDAGIVLPDYVYPVGAEVEAPSSIQSENRLFTADVVSREARLRYELAVYVWNNRLYLTGNVADWEGFLSVRFYYIAQVDPLTTLTGATGTLVVPNATEPCLVAYLAHFMAKRNPKTQDVEAPDKRIYRNEWKEAEEDFFEEMAMHVQAEVSVVRDVF